MTEDAAEFLKDQAFAIELVKSMGRASVKLAESPVDRKLLAKMGPNKLAGAYIMRSVELMVMQGGTVQEIMQQHSQMVEVIHKAMTAMLEESDRRSVRH
jgi:hypothetical protein